MYTGLVCKNVLLTYNNAASLRKHFSKFGNVLRVYSNTNKNSATIKFADHVGLRISDINIYIYIDGHKSKPAMCVLAVVKKNFCISLFCHLFFHVPR